MKSLRFQEPATNLYASSGIDQAAILSEAYTDPEPTLSHSHNIFSPFISKKQGLQPEVKSVKKVDSVLDWLADKRSQQERKNERQVNKFKASLHHKRAENESHKLSDWANSRIASMAKLL